MELWEFEGRPVYIVNSMPIGLHSEILPLKNHRTHWVIHLPSQPHLTINTSLVPSLKTVTVGVRTSLYEFGDRIQYTICLRATLLSDTHNSSFKLKTNPFSSESTRTSTTTQFPPAYSHILWQSSLGDRLCGYASIGLAWVPVQKLGERS